MPRLPFRGDFLQASRDRVSRGWRSAAIRYASRLGRFALFGPGALAAAGVSNLVTRIPKLDTMPSARMAILGKRKRGSKRKAKGKDEDVSGYIQLSRRYSNFIRPISQMRYLQKFLSSQIDYVIDRWQSLTPTGGANGSYWLSNTVTGTSPARTRNLPVYTFELNSLRNNRGEKTNTTDVQAIPMLRLRHTESTNSLNFSANCYGYDNLGATGTASPYNLWQRERVPYRGNNADTYSPFSYAMVDWVEICIPIWGATTNPSSVDVFVCRLLDEDQQPVGYGYEDGVGKSFYPEPSSAGDEPAYENFQHSWASFVDDTNGNYARKHVFPKAGLKMNVLKHQRFDFNPTANYENDSSGHQKIFKMFLRLNELTSYVTETSTNIEGQTADFSNEIAFDNNINRWPVTDLMSHNLPFAGNKKARLFLIIKGQNAAVDAGDSAAQCPSFDLMVRRRYSYLS